MPPLDDLRNSRLAPTPTTIAVEGARSQSVHAADVKQMLDYINPKSGATSKKKQ